LYLCFRLYRDELASLDIPSVAELQQPIPSSTSSESIEVPTIEEDSKGAAKKEDQEEAREQPYVVKAVPRVSLPPQPPAVAEEEVNLEDNVEGSAAESHRKQNVTQSATKETVNETVAAENKTEQDIPSFR